VIDAFGRPQAAPGELAALEDQRAFADRSGYRKLEVGGADARPWLNDLLTAPIAGLGDGRACRSLLLSATGRIRADLHVLPVDAGLLLLQDPAQPAPIADLLAPYVLSSAVTLTDRTAELGLYCALGRAASRVGWPGTRPSVLGEGEDLLTPAAGAARLEAMMMNKQLTEVGSDALEVWRIRRGIARFPIDLQEDSVPAEARLETLIDLRKGCFLGQESVAKIRNLGHPSHVIRSVRTDADVAAGIDVSSDGEVVGRLTSAAAGEGGGTVALARVRWSAAEATLTTAGGVRLDARDAIGLARPGSPDGGT
jgi:folate-binding protein YgfZ